MLYIHPDAHNETIKDDSIDDDNNNNNNNNLSLSLSMGCTYVYLRNDVK